jgi:GT2 family glycosyltransferase
VEAELLPVPGDHWRVRYPLPQPPPFVSLIIPTRNGTALLRQAVSSILEKTDYPRYEILIVDNGSDDPEALRYLSELGQSQKTSVRVLRYDAPFNYSAINNFAAAEAKGDILAFLNNDVEAIHADWLSEMVSQAVRPGIGAVGAMLYYPLNTVQHAGVILGLGGVAGHPFKEFPRGDQGNKNRMRLVQNYSAVTAACVVILKARFAQVGGFNEKDLPIAFNDVDLCCRLLKAGFRNLWTPFAEFFHHESATRGVDNTPEKKARFQSEIDYMVNTWGDLLAHDPAYNPNLTLVGEDFSPAYLTRARKPWLAHLP